MTSWAEGIIPRTDIEAFSNGLYRPATMAKLDSLGQGPSGAFKVGKRVYYPEQELIEWLNARVRRLSVSKES